MANLAPCKDAVNYQPREGGLFTGYNRYAPTQRRVPISTARILRHYVEKEFRVYVTRLDYQIHTEDVKTNPGTGLFRTGTMEIHAFYVNATMEFDVVRTLDWLRLEFHQLDFLCLGQRITQQKRSFKHFDMLTSFRAVVTLASVRRVKLNLLVGNDAA